MTLNEFIHEVEVRTWRILDDKGPNPTRQAIATTRGQQFEKTLMDMLDDHPAVESVEEQVFDETIDELSNIDIVVNLKNGKRVYVPCARDLWKGTSQQDRLQCVWFKYKTGLFDRNEVVYLCLDPLADILEWVPQKRNVRRKLTLQKWVEELADKNIMQNVDTFWDHLTSLS